MLAHNNFPVNQMLSGAELELLRLPISEVQFDGNNYQPGDEQECATRLQSIQSKVTAGSPDLITLGEYQRWVELNWLTPHHTFSTAERLTRKLVEEGPTEYLDEIVRLPARSEVVSGDHNTAKSIDEMGDVLWSLVANASNLGIDLEATVARKFNTNQPVTLQTIQQIIEASPLWVPLWLDADIEEVGTVFSDTDDLDPQVLLPLTAYQIMAHTAAAFQFGNSTTASMTPEQLSATADFHADALMIYCYYISQWSRSNLGEIVNGNLIKITDRVAKNQLDKSLGNR